MKKLLLIALSLALTIGLFAQTTDRKWALGIKGGSQQYNGDIGNGFYNINQAFYGFGGVIISRNLSNHLALNIGATTGDLGYVDDVDRRFLSRMTQYSSNLKLAFFKNNSRTLNPYLSGGFGYIKFKDRYVSNDSPVGRYNATKTEFDNMILPSIGLGLTVKLSPIVNLVLDESYLRSDYDAIDNHAKNAKDIYLQHSLALVFNIGKGKDSDKDGVRDNIDECPNIFGVKSLNGCPDSDNDGIADNKDDCPNKKGPKNLNGCPDSDNDGIADNKDDCPNKKGPKNLNGCPDSDNDGIADNKDDCPNKKGPKNLNGCPDSDNDGIVDNKDDCPNKKGSKKLNGCPDSDNDGIADKDDDCPKVKGTKKANGCPEKNNDKIDKPPVLESVYTVYFERGDSQINKVSKTILNTVAQIAKKRPTAKLELKGFTDADGDEKLNLILSKKRAKMVKTFLINKGVNGKRISTQGYGENNPVDSNSSESGKAKNRRVELYIK